MNRTIPLKEGEDVSELWGTGLWIIQSQKGYRYSLDAVLLAHFASPIEASRVLDLGAGNGAVTLLLAVNAVNNVKGRLVGLEIQKVLADQARRSIQLNRLQDRVQIIEGDLQGISRIFSRASFQVVVSNPPYRGLETGRLSPTKEIQVAKHEVLCRLEDVTQAASYCLPENGRFCVIYPASRLTALFSCLQAWHLEPKRLRLVYPRLRTRAELVLVEARKGGRPELSVLPPLFLYVDKGKEFTPEFQSIYASFRVSNG